MCLAIFKPAKAHVSEVALRNGWQGNSDGAGFAYIRGGKVVIEKGFMTVKDFLEAYNTAQKANKRSPFVIHFRIGTQGDKHSPENTHPFPIKNGVLIHNGHLSGTGAYYGKGKSDTCLFAEKVGDDLTFELVSKNKQKFEDAIAWNKIVLLYGDGSYIILNDKQGVWKDDVWYSNRSFESGGRSNWTPQSNNKAVEGMLG